MSDKPKILGPGQAVNEHGEPQRSFSEEEIRRIIQQEREAHEDRPKQNTTPPRRMTREEAERGVVPIQFGLSEEQVRKIVREEIEKQRASTPLDSVKEEMEPGIRTFDEDRELRTKMKDASRSPAPEEDIAEVTKLIKSLREQDEKRTKLRKKLDELLAAIERIRSNPRFDAICCMGNTSLDLTDDTRKQVNGLILDNLRRQLAETCEQVKRLLPEGK
jgi:hypothetical protein